MIGKRAAHGWQPSARRWVRNRSNRLARCWSSIARTRKRNWIPAPRQRHSGASYAGMTSLKILHVPDLELLQPARSPNLDDVALALPDEGLGDRRGVGDLAELDVGLVLADDLVAHRLASRRIDQLHRGAAHHAPVVVEQRPVDDLRGCE